jgi:hypothetical protein
MTSAPNSSGALRLHGAPIRILAYISINANILRRKEGPGAHLAVVLVDVWMTLFREEMNNKSVTRAVTLPQWLDMRAKEAHLNYSKTLQDGLMKSLGIQREINHRPGKKKKPIPA